MLSGTGLGVDQSLTVAQYNLHTIARNVRLPIARPERLGAGVISLALLFGGDGGGFRVSSGEDVVAANAGATALMGLRTGEGTGRARIKNRTIEKKARTIVRWILSE